MAEGKFSDEVVARNIDTACDRFENAWQAGDGPLIEDYLASTCEPLRSQLLRQLVLLELELSTAVGRPTSLADYIDRFPDDRSVVKEALASSSVASQETVLPDDGSISTHGPIHLANKHTDKSTTDNEHCSKDDRTTIRSRQVARPRRAR